MSQISGLSFDEQKRFHWRSSLGIFVVVALVYFLAIGAMIIALPMGVAGPAVLLIPGRLTTFILVSAIIAVALAWLHFRDARLHGANNIKELVRAAKPDLKDRFHRQYANLVEEMAVASGLREVRAYVLPSLAVNSMAIIEADGVPAVLTSEGMLAQCSRDELQAAVAHELAHILSGDAFYVTLICSLAAFFERLKESMEIDEGGPRSGSDSRDSGGGIFMGAALVYVVAGAAGGIMRLLTMAISRQREYLADARAADMTRHPMALASVIYKAHLANSTVGNFANTYSPLFIVSPQSRASESEGFFANLVSTHPPVRRRVGLLAAMAYQTETDVLREVWEDRRQREASQIEIDSAEPAEGSAPLAAPDAANGDHHGEKRWEVRNPQGCWEGPFNAKTLPTLPFFTPQIQTRDLASGETGPARHFPDLTAALARRGGTLSVDDEPGPCPRCGQKLRLTESEGAPLLRCSHCSGHLVFSRHDVNKFLARREHKFSQNLRRKAREAAKTMIHISNTPKSAAERAKLAQKLHCPRCGEIMRPRPYNYRFFLPVDECFACGSIWFDTDELEILQIWVERTGDGAVDLSS
jgi:heat shock protein HtpX